MSIQAVSWVLDHSRAQLGARLVLLSIANHADARGSNSFPSVRTLASEALMSDRQVQRAIHRLVKLGELAVEAGAGRNGTHLYAVLGMWGDKKSPGSRVTNRAERGDKSGKKQAQNVTQTVLNQNSPTGELTVLTHAREAPFALWWRLYPHKVGKGAAATKFAAALKKAKLDALTDGVLRYIANKPPDREWCNPATWLHQERWLDEPARPINGHHAPAATIMEAVPDGVAIHEREEEDRRLRRALTLPLLDRERAGPDARGPNR